AKVAPAPTGQSGRRDDESKIGVDTAAGWAAYLNGGSLFLKRFPYDPHGQYLDGGANVEDYSSAEFRELENLGPLITLAPGQETALTEDWWLWRGVTIPADEPAALAALDDYLRQSK